jgi:hypothetical protein
MDEAEPLRMTEEEIAGIEADRLAEKERLVVIDWSRVETDQP